MKGNDMEMKMNEESELVDEICPNNFTSDIYITEPCDMDIYDEPNVDLSNITYQCLLSATDSIFAFLMCGKILV